MPEIKNKISIFIDDGNMWSSCKSIGKFLDYSKFKEFFGKKYNGEVVDIFLYKAYPKEGSREYSLDAQHKFMTFLEKGLGFNVRKKELKKIMLRDQDGNLVYDQKTELPKSIEKGNLDVELTIDAVNSKKKYNVAILFSGDSDFLPLVTFLRNRGKRVFTCSTKNSVSTELKRGVDGYMDMADCPEIHGSPIQHRAHRKKKARPKASYL